MSEWRPVPSHPCYSVSDLGEIKNKDGKIIGQWMIDQGYMLARLSKPRAAVRVHRIVAAAFVPNPDMKPVVNHIDCDRANNAATNLEWVTQAENLAHATSLGRLKRDYWLGKPSPNRKISSSDAARIKEDRERNGTSYSKLSDKYGLSKRSIGRIINGEYYANG